MVCFFQAEDGIRDLVRSRGLGDVYKRQPLCSRMRASGAAGGRSAAATGGDGATSQCAGQTLSLIHI